MYISYINILIFYVYICIEPEVSFSGRRLYIQLRYGALYVRQYKQSSK
jgi:hypothetical protein